MTEQRRRLPQRDLDLRADGEQPQCRPGEGGSLSERAEKVARRTGAVFSGYIPALSPGPAGRMGSRLRLTRRCYGSVFKSATHMAESGF
jgi:hypothetical protein